MDAGSAPTPAPEQPPLTGAKAALSRHFPPEVCEAYSRWCSTGDPASADTVVMAAVVDHIPDRARRPTGPLEDRQSLIDDLGFDSMAITELVFFMEDLFQVTITNQEILSIRTVGDLRAFARGKFSAASPPPPANA
jgi:acyl carrier protein